MESNALPRTKQPFPEDKTMLFPQGNRKKYLPLALSKIKALSLSRKSNFKTKDYGK